MEIDRWKLERNEREKEIKELTKGKMKCKKYYDNYRKGENIENEKLSKIPTIRFLKISISTPIRFSTPSVTTDTFSFKIAEIGVLI